MTSLQSHEGACHCGAVGFVYRTALPPEAWSIRACQCTFCRTHAALSTSDPRGFLQFLEHTPDALNPYRFGRKTADFLICRNCGAFIGAIMRSGNNDFGIINVRVLQSVLSRLQEAKPMHYENEGPAERTGRREGRWTPIAVG